MTGVIVGIDPGATGAIAHIDTDARLLHVEDIPIFDGHVNAPVAATVLLAHGHITGAFIERAHPMPNMGVSGAFRYGAGWGCLLGVLGALSIPVHHVGSAQWKRAAKLGRDKSASRRLATELWPEHAERFARVKDDGRAEAALIARHGWHSLAGVIA